MKYIIPLLLLLLASCTVPTVENSIDHISPKEYDKLCNLEKYYAYLSTNDNITFNHYAENGELLYQTHIINDDSLDYKANLFDIILTIIISCIITAGISAQFFIN
jgi:hypothetical protein